jgi:solute carrier family 35 protein F1/2
MSFQHFSPYWLYFPAFIVVILGLIIYFWHATRKSIQSLVLLNVLLMPLPLILAEEQGRLDPKAPAYIRRLQPDDQV